MARRALMMRTAAVRSMYITASKRRRSEMPGNTNRSWTAEWRGSATILPNGSPKTVAASSNDTPCLARFPAALRGSHSNSSANPHYTCGSRIGAPAQIGRVFHRHSSACSAAGRLDNWITPRKSFAPLIRAALPAARRARTVFATPCLHRRVTDISPRSLRDGLTAISTS